MVCEEAKVKVARDEASAKAKAGLEEAESKFQANPVLPNIISETLDDVRMLCSKFQADSKKVNRMNELLRLNRCTDMKYVTDSELHDGVSHWMCQFSAKQLSGKKILAVSKVGCKRKPEAISSAFLMFLDSLEEVEKDRPKAPPPMSKKTAQQQNAFLAPSETSSTVQPQNSFKAQSTPPAMHPERIVYTVSQTSVPETNSPIVEKEIKQQAMFTFSEKKPVAPNKAADSSSLTPYFLGKPHLLITFPEITIKSLMKWFKNPKNSGRLRSISKLLGSKSFGPSSMSSPQTYNVNHSLLERKSIDLFQDQLAFVNSPRGKEIIAYRTSLPVFFYRDDIVAVINGHQVVLISAENGYGKSTQVPDYILEQMTMDSAGAQCNIIVVCGSALAAKTLAGCVAEERGETLGQRVTFQEEVIEDRQRFGSLTFCTGDVLLKLIQGNQNLYGFSHVVIDNVDDGGLVSEFMLFAMEKILERRAELRLVMLSSLIEVNQYQMFFAQRSFNALVMAPYQMQIQQFFLEDYLPLLDRALVSSKDSDDFVKEEIKYGEESSRLGSPKNGSQTLSTEHMPYSLVEAILGQLCRSTSPTEPIMVFLPSGEEISTLHRFLTEDDILQVGYAEESFFRFIFVHPNVRNLDGVYGVDYHAALPVRKIYLCTSEAESTFPVTNVVHVIDTCKYKPRILEVGSMEGLGTYRWISQVECIRRSRCAGRLNGAGSYYSLMSLQRFIHLTTEALSDVHRFDASYVMMKMKELMPAAHLEDALPRLLHPFESKTSIMGQVEKLKVLKYMVHIDNLTLLGTLLSKLPLPAHIAKLILYGFVFRCLEPVLVLAAASITGSPFISPRPGDETNSYLAFRSSTSSDQVCVLEAFKAWWNLKTTRKPGNRPDEQAFCL